jgi:Fur family ferric uptake transcriptional regulator
MGVTMNQESSVSVATTRERRRHHLVCRECGRSQHTGCVTGPAPCLDPAESGGFLVDDAEVVFWGLCPDCRAAIGAPGISATS